MRAQEVPPLLGVSVDGVATDHFGYGAKGQEVAHADKGQGIGEDGVALHALRLIRQVLRGRALPHRPNWRLIGVDAAVVDPPALGIGAGLDLFARSLALDFGCVR
jgi:hypothetical protein